jgi:hypothetical protein
MYTLPANGNLGDVFNQTIPAKISLGSSLCDLNFYSIKYYNIALSDNNVINNYLESIVSTSNYTEKIQKNDIYDNLKENITFEGIKNNGNISYMILTGNALPLTKNQEDLLVDIEYKCAFDDTLSFTEKDASIALQGTSSVRYRRKNYKIKCKNKHLLDYGQIKTKTFCLKADYAEATGTHNTQTANMVENFYAIGSAAKTPPQYKVLRDNNFNTELTNLAMPRTTIYGYPIVLFQRTYNEMGAEKIEFIGKYNFNFDKGSKEVFGFTDDNPGAECWEFRFNEKPACIFKEEIELDVWNAWI